MTADQPFSRPVPLRMEMPPTTVHERAGADERAAVAALLELVGIDALEIDATIARAGRGFAVDGRVRARVSQSCVVTFDPVPAELEIAVRRALVLDGPMSKELEVDPLGDDVDHLEAPMIDLGAVAVEELSLGLEPYPRAPHADAALEAVATPVDGPFAALARRRGDA